MAQLIGLALQRTLTRLLALLLPATEAVAA